MSFFEALRRVSSAPRARPVEPTIVEVFETVETPTAPTVGGAEATVDIPSADPLAFDRTQWHKKLKRVLEGLPARRNEWEPMMAEARALGFDPEWIAATQIEEFVLLIRRAVADRHFTEAEHQKLDLARDLIEMPEAEAAALLQVVVAEAEEFFGQSVEGA